jgi:hypothetical protein
MGCERGKTSIFFVKKGGEINIVFGSEFRPLVASTAV